MFTETIGTLWSSCRITLSPLGSVNVSYGTVIFGAACCAAVWVVAAANAADCDRRDHQTSSNPHDE